MWLEAIRGTEAHATQCPTCGGDAQRRVYGEMHAGSSLVDGQRVDICRVPHPEYRDPIVLDGLCVYFDGGLYRLWPSERYFSRGGKKLHRAVWERAFGVIPAGCHIHHRDGDSANNRLANLECLPVVEHRQRRHAPKNQRGFTPAARAASAAWHASEAGRLWHSRMATRSKSWTKWKRVERACEHCGVVQEMLDRKSGCVQRFCSTTCKALAYRRRREAERKG